MSNPLNITTASFGGLREVATSPLWQWDYGQILKIKGLDLPQAFEVHFSNSRKSGETVTQIGTDSQVVIPDMYLTSGADIYCFIFLHDGLTDGETEYVIKIPVRERPEPSDIEPTPEQQDAITEAIAALNVAVTKTGQDVISADASAQAAAQSATNAQTAAQSAQGSATAASASATTASTAAAMASTKASEAATSAANAASAKTAAETAETNAKAAQTASESARASAQSAAQTATTKASEASTSATSAAGSASAASVSASQASESATSAANSATAASASATAAATSASTATTKASEASASATAAQTAQTAAQAAQAAAETAQAEAEAAKDETVTEAASIRGLLKDKADIIISNAEGAIATFNDGGDDMPMMSCVAKIEAVQSGEGDPSPENIRPITGWTGCNVVVSPTQDAQDGTTYPISWQSEAGTVYGGTVDLVSGVLTVTAVGKVFNGTEDWASYQTSPNRFYRYTFTNAQTNNSINVNRACSHFRNATVITSTTSVGFNGYTSSGMNSMWFNFRPDLEEIPDVDAWNAWLAEQYANGTPVQAYCPITTPITYQLTPVEVKTLLGLNNVWADTGDVELQYRADTKLYIDQHQPDVPVEDVQINGTSIVDDGVANVPTATANRYGVIKVDQTGDYGLTRNDNGLAYIYPATSANIKNGVKNRVPIVPATQQESVFYGLTKAAGVDMASSSNSVGTYTDEAKVAIQKMLGIYEAPWELIREDTGTNATEADIEITVDGNGQPFELTDLVLKFNTPTQDAEASVGSYGRINVYYGSTSNYDTLYIGAYTQAAGTTRKTGIVQIKQSGGMIERIQWKSITDNSERSPNSIIRYDGAGNSLFTFNSETRIYDKIVIQAVAGTWRYKLYGKRKWQ